MNSVLDQITRPALLVDKEKVVANIRRMKAKADRLGMAYRPHFKTHQSLEVGRWHKSEGITSITVSSVHMATYFASEWDDITIAFPVNLREVGAISSLLQKIRKLNLLIESPDVVHRLGRELTGSVHLFIKIDTGYHRTGVAWQDDQTIRTILRAIAEYEHVSFAGFLVHAGHTYDVFGKEAIEPIHQEAISALEELNKRYRAENPDMIISYGDTPSASLMADFGPVQELRPGNLAYYDVMQMQIGSCSWEQIAVCMACPVVSVHPERNELVVYGGGVHLSKDMIELNGRRNYGLPVHFVPRGWSVPIEGGHVRKLSQEHGVVKLPSNELEKFEPGSLIGILPVHSCMAVDCIDDCFTLTGEKLVLL